MQPSDCAVGRDRQGGGGRRGRLEGRGERKEGWAEGKEGWREGITDQILKTVHAAKKCIGGLFLL